MSLKAINQLPMHSVRVEKYHITRYTLKVFREINSLVSSLVTVWKSRQKTIALFHTVLVKPLIFP